MSYPQPNPDQYALGGQQFWRLNTPLTSDGDIYESQQGASGFAIGPDSDISKVNIAYYDDQVANFMNQIAITPQRPFPGTLYARNDAAYSPSNRPGRFLIWPDENFNSNYIPGGGTDLTRTDFIIPVLDVVEYFSPIGQIANRNDKEYEWFVTPFSDDIARWFIVVPYYGRRYASLTVQNNNATIANLAVTARAVTYKQSSVNTAIENQLPSVAMTLNPNQQDNAVVKASVDGMFDAMVLEFFGGGVAPNTDVSIRLRVSDTEV